MAAFAGDHQAAAGGFLAAARAAERERFAGDDGRGGVAHVHRVGVHDPGHGLLVGAQIRSGNVALGPDKLDDLRGIAASDALDFAHGKFGRIADHATLRAAKRNVNDGAFPRHPGGKRANFVESHVGSEADATLARPAHDGVMDAVADENFHVPVIERHRDVHRNLLVGVLHVAVQAFFETQTLGSHFEARFGGFVDVEFVIGRGCDHGFPLRTAGMEPVRSATPSPRPGARVAAGPGSDGKYTSLPTGTQQTRGTVRIPKSYQRRLAWRAVFDEFFDQEPRQAGRIVAHDAVLIEKVVENAAHAEALQFLYVRAGRVRRPARDSGGRESAKAFDDSRGPNR